MKNSRSFLLIRRLGFAYFAGAQFPSALLPGFSSLARGAYVHVLKHFVHETQSLGKKTQASEQKETAVRGFGLTFCIFPVVVLWFRQRRDLVGYN